MKIENIPLLYKKYKDKKINYGFINGIVVGYFFNIKCEVVLIVEINQRGLRKNNFNNFIKRKNISPKDYHGDPSKCFFFVRESDFNNQIAHEVKF